MAGLWSGQLPWLLEGQVSGWCSDGQREDEILKNMITDRGSVSFRITYYSFLENCKD